MAKLSCGQKGKIINNAVVIGEQEGGLYKLKGHPEQALIHDIVGQMKFGIEGLHMCTTEHYLLQENLLKVFQKFRKNMMESTKDVWKEKT